ncbi:MAG TPA: hypothetical protein VGB17_02865 [Pyrinomonadaceae bacterium]|jgi:DNA repair protein RadC
MKLYEDFPNKEQLEGAGFDSIEKIRGASDDELDAVEGIGPASIEKIRAAVEHAEAHNAQAAKSDVVTGKNGTITRVFE